VQGRTSRFGNLVFRHGGNDGNFLSPRHHSVPGLIQSGFPMVMHKMHSISNKKPWTGKFGARTL
jgi:hypothetical protein